MSAQNLPMHELNQRLDDAMTGFAGRTAFVEGTHSRTFEEMRADVGCASAWVEAYGHQEGDRVAALTSNRSGTVALEWATYRRGGIWIGIPARERDPGNLRRVLEDFSPVKVGWHLPGTRSSPPSPPATERSGLGTSHSLGPPLLGRADHQEGGTSSAWPAEEVPPKR